MLNLLKPQFLGRYRDIAWLLYRHGRTDLVDAGELADDTPKDTSPGSARAEELAEDLEAMGPTFVKLGQVLASRADLLPQNYRDALGRLTDDVESFAFDEARLIIEQALGIAVADVFESIDETPLAAASLGQVHRARLADGRDVVVKVQRPGVKQRIHDDIAALAEIARLVESHTDFGKRYRLMDVLRQFKRSIANELNYEHEAENLWTLRQNLERFELLVVPESLPELTAEQVLTTTYVSCTPLTDIDNRRRESIDGEALAGELFHAYLQQVVIDGFFHADPHPGNVQLTDDGRIVLLDMGLTGRVPPMMRDHLLHLLIAVAEGRSDDAVRLAIRLGFPDEDFDESRFAEQISELVSEAQNSKVGDMRIGRLVMQIAEIAAAARIRLPSQLTMLGRMLMHLDHVGKLLSESFSPNAAIRQHAMELMQQHMRSRFTPRYLLSAMFDAKDFAEKLPGRLDRIIETVAQNRLRLNVNAIDEDRLISGIQKVANRITSGLVLAALIIGAALLMNIDTGPTLLGYPLLALVLFVAAASLGFLLVINIMFRDR
jgi:predicted unusual protein kinase regulating ubiquinone biosynthesis (AarF/ABC1/UbiB family)